jgi:hypothetical protein
MKYSVGCLDEFRNLMKESDSDSPSWFAECVQDVY